MPRHPLPMLILAALIAGLTPGPSPAQEAAPTPEQVQFFEAKVRPILAEHCAKCHGPTKPKAGLRLDSRAALLEGGDTGPAVVPGKPEESVLIEAVNYEGPEMPPAGKLPAAKLDVLTSWVAMGAPWPGGDHDAPAPTRKGPFQITEKDRDHWAFRPIARPSVPSVEDSAHVANPIDAFILAKLEAKGLKPNPPASKQELIRRASYDLTGLPPTPEDVEAFVADPSPNAYEALIDRLLESPRYGEKWGRHWLDLVRFAETNSFERDDPKPNAWRYRDYVIRSLNEDKPYGQFVREQLAGDELPGSGPDALIATGFYRLGIWDDEPADREQALYDGLDDLVATTGQVFLGLTIDCARCHDHKLDPIPQKDYYRLVSFFRNITPYRNGGRTDEAVIVADPEGKRAYERAVAEMQRRREEVQAELAEIEGEFRARYEQKHGRRIERADLEDLRYRFYRDTWESLPDFAELKPEDSGTLPRPFFDLSPRTRDEAFGFVFDGELVVPRDGTYTFELDSDDGARLTVEGETIVAHDGVHVLGAGRTGSVALTKGRVPIRLEYFQKADGMGLSVAWSGPGLPRRSLSAGPDAGAKRGAGRSPQAIATLIRTEGAEILGADRVEQVRQLRRELKEMNRRGVAAEKALCVTEKGRKAPETFVLARGNPQAPAEKVEPAFLQVLGGQTPEIPEPAGARTSGRRRVLADWIASPANPLAPRVIANRLWQHHFGRGIVRSPNNFGLHGDRPTHPELLDWLASEFLEQGGRLKPLHKLIMTSAAYRMSSRGNPEALAADPTNDLFWRFDMRRLTAEEIRDSVLAVSGSLNLSMYGPGVYPEIPAEVLAGQSMPGSGWGKSPPDQQNRRSVYVHVKRSLLMPILESFDVAETDRSSPVRFSTTQPTQALAMLNGAFLHRQAAALAARLRREAGDDPARQVERALRLVTSRVPESSDVRRGVDLIGSLRGRDGLGADAALESFCLVALNLNEFVFLD